MSPTKKVNAALIAKECGVSVMTVTRAFRQDLSIAEAKRKRILQVSEKMGYYPNVNIGRPMRMKNKTRPIVNVIIGTSTKSLFYSELLLSIEQELAKHNYDCVIRSCSADYTQFLGLYETLRMVPTANILVVGYLPIEQLKSILNLIPNLILVDHTGDSRLECPYNSVGFDNVEAARLAVRHLLNTGRRRILLLKGFSAHYFSREVEQGYTEVLRESGVRIDGDLILESDFTAEGASEVIKSAIDSGIEFDAIFTNDEMACGVFRSLHECKLSIPEDVAVAGCDGLPVGLHLMPRLTTVVLDYRKLGWMAVKHLFASREKSLPLCRVKLLPVLEVRESTVTQKEGEGK